jgi:YegS/Rv2252/BmrU family lipid kinase
MAILDKKALLIINPVAGSKQIQRYVVQIVRSLMDKGYLVTTMVTAGRTDARDWTARFGADFDLVVCAGGDGTLNECASGMADADLSIPLGYIPCGSTNDFAAYHDLPTDMLKAARQIVLGDQRPVDVISYDNEHFSINASDFGIFTWISYSTSQRQKNMLGGLAYVLEGVKDFKKLRSQYVKVTANNMVFEGDILFGLICNATRVVGTLTKKGKIIQGDDGIMEIGLVEKPKNAIEFQNIIKSIQSGELTHKNIHFFKAKKITLETKEPLDWSMDGEHYVSPLCCEIESLRHRITLIC